MPNRRKSVYPIVSFQVTNQLPKKKRILEWRRNHSKDAYTTTIYSEMNFRRILNEFSNQDEELHPENNLENYQKMPTI